MDEDLSQYAFDTLGCTWAGPGVLEVALNRPKKLNAMNPQFWVDLTTCMGIADSDSNVRCVVITGGESRIFSAGLDLMESFTGASKSLENSDLARKALRMDVEIRTPQDAISAVEKCRKPVVCALHNGVVGGGVDLACACDIRYCSEDTYFTVAEVKVGLAADIGTLQRLPKIVGNDSIVRELALTGRRMASDEAFSLGLVGKVLPSKQECWDAARETASTIAEHSPVAVLSTKVSLNYSRDHTTQEGLDHIRAWNMTMLQTTDLMEAVTAQMQKRKASFSKL